MTTQDPSKQTGDPEGFPVQLKILLLVIAVGVLAIILRASDVL